MGAVERTLDVGVQPDRTPKVGQEALARMLRDGAERRDPTACPPQALGWDEQAGILSRLEQELDEPALAAGPRDAGGGVTVARHGWDEAEGRAQRSGLPDPRGVPLGERPLQLRDADIVHGEDRIIGRQCGQERLEGGEQRPPAG